MKPRYFSVSEKLVSPDCPSFVCHPLAELPTVWRRRASRVCFLERWTPERHHDSGTLLWSGDHRRGCERNGERLYPPPCASCFLTQGRRLPVGGWWNGVASVLPRPTAFVPDGLLSPSWSLTSLR